MLPCLLRQSAYGQRHCAATSVSSFLERSGESGPELVATAGRTGRKASVQRVTAVVRIKKMMMPQTSEHFVRESIDVVVTKIDTDKITVG
jgi:hypothetical protein